MDTEATMIVTVLVCAFIGREPVGSWEVWLVIPSWRWREDAACRGAGAEIFVPEKGTTTPRLVELLCPICEVRETCEMVGRLTRSVGWWGGIYLKLGPPVRSDYEPRKVSTQVGDLNRSKTVCVKGHPYDEVNTYHRVDGRRGCKQCRKDTVREYRRAQRQAQRKRLNA